MYESSGSQFFKTTTGIQSGPDAFDESRFVMTFLTILGVMEILCSFRLVLKGKAGKEIPEPSRFEFLEKFLANNFALSDAEDNTSGPLKRGGIADLPLLRTPCHIQNFAIFRRVAYLGPEAYSESYLFRHIQAYSDIFNDDSYNNINLLFFTLILHTF